MHCAMKRTFVHFTALKMHIVSQINTQQVLSNVKWWTATMLNGIVNGKLAEISIGNVDNFSEDKQLKGKICFRTFPQRLKLFFFRAQLSSNLCFKMDSVLLNWVNRNSPFVFVVCFFYSCFIEVFSPWALDDPRWRRKNTILTRCDIFMCRDPERNESENSVSLSFIRWQGFCDALNCDITERSVCTAKNHANALCVFSSYYRFEMRKRQQQKKNTPKNKNTTHNARESRFIEWHTEWAFQFVLLQRLHRKSGVFLISRSFISIALFWYKMSTTHWINFHWRKASNQKSTSLSLSFFVQWTSVKFWRQTRNATEA